MIHFITTRGHEYTIKFPGCDVQSYDEFWERSSPKQGTYVFTDMERMSPFDLERASHSYSRFNDRGCRVFNNPARVMGRYELLRTLYEEGLNSFDVARADDFSLPDCPVFLRSEQDHGTPFSGLLYSFEEVENALASLQERGISRRGVLIVQYRGEPFDGRGRFRKFSTFRVGDEVFAHHVVVEDNWCVKYGNAGVALPDGYQQLEETFIKENWHADKIRAAFEIANIEYGRADWNVVNGRVEIYEINTNPMLTHVTDKMKESLAALETKQDRKWYQFYEEKND